MSRFFALCLGFILTLLALAGLQFWLANPAEPVAAAPLLAPLPVIEDNPDTIFDQLANLIVEPGADMDNSPQPNALIKPRDAEKEPVNFLEPASFEEVPPELMEMIRAVFTEYAIGNYEYAALLALDTLEMSEDYPKVQLIMHTAAGISYEKIGYTDMVIEQYQQALAIFPEHPHSYSGLRRLDPAFAASHPPLPKPEAKQPNTAAQPAITVQ